MTKQRSTPPDVLQGIKFALQTKRRTKGKDGITRVLLRTVPMPYAPGIWLHYIDIYGWERKDLRIWLGSNGMEVAQYRPPKRLYILDPNDQETFWKSLFELLYARYGAEFKNWS